MSYIKTVAYTDSDAAFYVNSHRIGLVRSAVEKTITELYPLRSFGDVEPAALGRGNISYEIELRREQSDDMLEFSMYDNFNLYIKRAHTTVCYGSCRCKLIQTERTAGEPMIEVATISAASRKEV